MKLVKRIFIVIVILGLLIVLRWHFKELLFSDMYGVGRYAWMKSLKDLDFRIACAYDRAGEIPADIHILCVMRKSVIATKSRLVFDSLGGHGRLLHPSGGYAHEMMPHDNWKEYHVKSSLTERIVRISKQRKKKRELILQENALNDPLLIALSNWELDSNGFRHNGIAEAENLIRKDSTNLNGQDSFDRTPIILALIFGRHDLAKMLIEKGADISLKDKMGRTCLHYAAKYRATDIIELLLSRGADINLADKIRYTPLIYSTAKYLANVAFGRKEEVIGDVNNANSDGNCFKAVKLLIDKGADVNAKGKDGLTALTHCYISRLFRTSRLLKGEKALLGWDMEGKSIRECEEKEFTYSKRYLTRQNKKIDLHKLVFWNEKVEMIEKYKDNDNFNITDEDGYTALSTAFLGLGEREAVIKYLLDNGARMPANGSNYSALMAACEWNVSGVVKRLLAEGEDPNIKDTTGRNAFDYARESGNAEVIKLLESIVPNQ